MGRAEGRSLTAAIGSSPEASLTVVRLLAAVAVDEADEEEVEEDSLPLLLFELSLWVRELPGLAAGAAVGALVDEPVELVSLSMKRLGVASVAAGAGADAS